jgi:fucokinase
MFDCIIVTASDQRQAGSYQREFEHRVRSGIVSSDALIVCVPDPVGARIGSGGATLNALQAGIGALWSKRHPGVPIAADSHWLHDKRFLILHSGGDSQRMPICSVRGKAFCALPSVADECATALKAPIDFLLRSFDRLTSACNGGCWVASTDVLLLMELQHTSYEWPSEGVCGLAIAVDKRLGPNHGVFHIDSAASADNLQRAHTVKAYVQKGSVPYLESVGAVQNEQVLLDSGIVYLSASFISDFLLCAQQSPINVATADGIARFPDTEPMRFGTVLMLPLEMTFFSNPFALQI